MTRPAYPYPHVARLNGTGDPTQAASWTKGPAAPILRLRDWPGADFFAPYEWLE